MCVCVYVTSYVHVYVFVHVYVYVHAYMYMYAGVQVSVCVCVSACMPMYEYMADWLYVWMGGMDGCGCVSARMQVCVLVCLFIWMVGCLVGRLGGLVLVQPII